MAFTKKIQILIELSGVPDSVDKLNIDLSETITSVITSRISSHNSNYSNKIALNFDITNNLDKNIKNVTSNCG